MARALSFREDFERYYRDTVVPVLVRLESERRALQAEDTLDVKVRSFVKPTVVGCIEHRHTQSSNGPCTDHLAFWNTGRVSSF